MKPLRIFISSPGDVEEERERARQVVEGLRRRYAGRLFLKPVLWEDLPLEAAASFQEGIDTVLSAEHGIDIAVFILWSRMGQLQDGGEHRSGTEREFALMREARARSADGRRPALFVYRREDDASFEERLRGRGTREQRELIEQKGLVERFIEETFQDAETGRNLRAFHRFDRPATFSQRLRAHLAEYLDELAGGTLETAWDAEREGPPFLGLEAFEARHAEIFFGREDEVLEGRRMLAEHARGGCAFLLITGASGSGKSSLARAGLLPAIAEQELDETVAEWRPLVVTPAELGADAVAGLVERLAAPGLLPGLRAEGVEFADVVESFRADAGAAARLLLKQAVAAEAKTRGGVERDFEETAVSILQKEALELLRRPVGESCTGRQNLRREKPGAAPRGEGGLVQGEAVGAGVVDIGGDGARYGESAAATPAAQVRSRFGGGKMAFGLIRVEAHLAIGALRAGPLDEDWFGCLAHEDLDLCDSVRGSGKRAGRRLAPGR